MRIEFNSLVENQIWNLIKRFDIKQNVIIEKWIFRLKRDRDDNSQRYKVRWVTHDFKQRHEVDLDKTFVSVVKSVSYKSLETINIIQELQIRHMNVVIAFLYNCSTKTYKWFNLTCSNLREMKILYANSKKLYMIWSKHQKCDMTLYINFWLI
jgi:hypothetical protein